MCGVAGIYHYGDLERTADREVVLRMTRALAHRGPDGEGVHIDGPVGLGHRRLAIVDLSPTGHQPMATENGTHWITYNGEFYNHAGFRRDLESRGHRFVGTSDTETMLRLLASGGISELPRVAGIFAFAYWDRAARSLLLVRDPLGVKQLYVHDDGKRIAFASEIKALLQCPGVPRAVDPVAVNQYLHFHAPLFERTFFRDVRLVRPGEYLQVDPRGPVRRTYWTVRDFTPRGGTPQESVGELRETLAKVVRDQLMSDVPVGAFMSGGIDSTAVAAYAAAAGKPPRCFGVHFSNQGVIDERPFQEATARSLGLELDLITLDGSSFPEDLPKLLYFQDQPIIGPAILPMYYVSQLAARRVKVCLGGQAADEVFGGYARYALVHPGRVVRSWLFDRQPSHSAPGVGGGAGPGQRRGGLLSGNLWKQLADRRNLMRLANNVGGLTGWRRRYFNNFAKVPERAWLSIFESRECVSRAASWELYDQSLDASPATDPADKVMHWDMQTFLPGLFHQDDRMSMANSLESRVPIADPRMVQFAFATGFDLKFRAGASKWILRQAVADLVPPAVLNRRKVGFDTPAETWMKSRHAAFVRETLLSRRARERGILSPAGVERLLADTDRPMWFDLAWKALCIEIWASVFLD
ncbi:MAG: asparagine synthase (glutamine-hydrolyzing), partial [Polyangiaceae bacterium]